LVFYVYFTKFGVENVPKFILNKENYPKFCFNLFTKLRNPDPKMFYRPPLSKLTENLVNEFTDYGKFPIKEYWYWNDVYNDSNSETTLK
jgi:hypothetical protein